MSWWCFNDGVFHNEMGPMMGWIDVCKLEEIEPEDVIRFDHGARTFAFYRSAQGAVFATDGQGNSAMSEFSKIGAAVIGTGFIGSIHIGALRRPGIEVQGVLGSSPQRGATRAAELGVAHAYSSLDELLSDANVRLSMSHRPTTRIANRSSKFWLPGGIWCAKNHCR